jgi:hypothetical protein
MFDEWKRIRSLKRELKEIDQEYRPRFRAVKTEEDSRALMSEYDAVAGETVSNIEIIRTRKLSNRCEKFGIDLMPFEEDWDIHPFTRRSYVSVTGHAKYNRRITDARFAYWKRWVDIVAPTASVIISLLALVIAAIAIYLQLS